MIYNFRNEAGKKEGILGRPMLDNAFIEMFEGLGGEDKVEGMYVAIERGDDQKLPGKRTMGTYEVSCWED